MKFLILLSVLFMGTISHAKEVCAGNVSDIKNIKAITDKVDLFGAWKGEYDSKAIAAEFGKSTSGNFTGKVTYDGKSYGPYNIKLCDDSGDFSAQVFMYTANFEVVSSKKIAVELPINGKPVVTMTKTTREFEVYDLLIR